MPRSLFSSVTNYPHARKGGTAVSKRQSAALDRKKFFGDPVMVITIIVLSIFLALFILYPLSMLLVDSVLIKGNDLYSVADYAGNADIIEVDRAIDSAVLQGLHQLTIIHGKGTGVLRTEIQKHLKTHKSIRTFRLGTFGEGDSGVTVAELK